MLAAALAGPPAGLILDGRLLAVAPSGWSTALPALPGFEALEWPAAVLARLLDAPSWAVVYRRCLDLDDPLDLPLLRAVCEGLVAAASGRDWWVGCRLAGEVASGWPVVDGRLSAAGVDWLAAFDSRPARALNVAYWLLVENADPDRRRRLDADLTAPPTGLPPSASAGAGWDPDAQGAAFMAAMAAGGGRGPS